MLWHKPGGVQTIYLLQSADLLAPLAALAGAVAIAAAFLWGFRTRTRAILAVFGIVMVYTAAHAATWSIRIGRQGATVSAPLSIAGNGGSMSWSEVAEVGLREEGLRRPQSVLVLRDSSGEEVEIPLTLLHRNDIAPVVEVVLRRSNASPAEAARVRAGIANAQARAADLLPLKVSKTSR